MCRNGLSLAVRVARQVHRVGGIRGLPQIINDFALAVNNLQSRLENLGVVQRDGLLRFLRRSLTPLALTLLLFLGLVGQTDTDRLLGQVHDVPDRRFDGVVPS